MNEEVSGSSDEADPGFPAWVRQHEPGLVRFVSVQVPAHEVEDIVQEVLIRADVAGHQKIAHPASWLRTTAMNVIVDENRFRTAKRRGGRDVRTESAAELAETAFWHSVAEQVGPEDVAETLDVIAKLRPLPPRLRHLAYLLVFERATKADAARELRCSQTQIGRYIQQIARTLAAKPATASQTQQHPTSAPEGGTA